MATLPQEDRTTAVEGMHKNLVMFGYVGYASRQTDILITIFRTAPRVKYWPRLKRCMSGLKCWLNNAHVIT